jgi:hypothetical protein
MKWFLALIIASYLLGALWAHVGAEIPAPWPVIGTPAYSAGCHLTHAWEDGSAVAYCPEDGAAYVYDPDGNDPPASIGYSGPRWEAGWYPQDEYDAMRAAQLSGLRVEGIVR